MSAAITNRVMIAGVKILFMGISFRAQSVRRQAMPAHVRKVMPTRSRGAMTFDRGDERIRRLYSRSDGSARRLPASSARGRLCDLGRGGCADLSHPDPPTVVARRGCLAGRGLVGGIS